jgi:hypothetical protein
VRIWFLLVVVARFLLFSLAWMIFEIRR